MSLSIEALLDHIEEHEDSLTQWEREFVDSIQHRLGEGRGLSSRQKEILGEIFLKCGGDDA